MEDIITFEEMSEIVLKYINQNHHPHTTIIVTPTSVQVLEGLKSTGETLDYIID